MTAADSTHTPRFAFDAVLFDMDGTLVATDRYWPQAAQEGATRAFEELGLDTPVPSQAQWMSLVGGELSSGVARLLPELDEAAREHVLRRCIEAEHAHLARGRAGFLPGVESTLAQLHSAGVRLGIASNCSARYLDQLMGDLNLGRWIEEARCLDSPRVRNKADMIEDLLAVFDTRSAVMVGDRAGDRDAAWANALPHVHLVDGYAMVGEDVAAQATLDSMDEMAELLSGRARDLFSLLGELVPASGKPFTLGVSGDLASGKTLLARDLARLGQGDVEVVELESVRRQPNRAGIDPLDEAYDLEALHRRLAQPASAPLRILEGPMLLDPRLRDLCQAHLYLEVPASISLERVQGRDARHSPVALEFATEVLLPWQRQWNEAHSPGELAQRTLVGHNPLRPLEGP
ncbi:MAG: HAD hydrolase-like protein [Planctomycetota bacterium]|jgi:phosphoglycolate phosphatase-like HAD superfamily hydrolase|nr:HAD hydrolase-like protein [Planctomycetota bacterium]